MRDLKENQYKNQPTVYNFPVLAEIQLDRIIIGIPENDEKLLGLHKAKLKV